MDFFNENAERTVVIRGAGDLASGIAVRLFNSGFYIVMTEIKKPTTVRRTVAFSSAVYEKSYVVEGIEAILCKSKGDAEEALKNNKIAVINDNVDEIIDEISPKIIVDAIIAKKNIATNINDAEIVIGVGPGFEAGKDCHAVIETKRGHYLGSVIRKGSAIENTGIPGLVGGYGIERLIRSSSSGKFISIAKIGDNVKCGDPVAKVGEDVIYAKIDGIVRGMLYDGIEVGEGFKLGDIDPRAELKHCFSVSDKARSVGGGVLEAILWKKRFI